MKPFLFPWLPASPSRTILAVFVPVLLILGSGGRTSTAQEATAEATSLFIETVGGATVREMPPSFTYDVDQNGRLDIDEVSTAVAERYPKMIWPEVYAVPLDVLLADLEASGETSWEIGAEFRVLEVPTLCAWFRVFLDVYERGDAFQQSAALDQAMYVLGGARGLTAEEGLAAFDGIRYASLGDPSLIQAFIDEGPCSGSVSVGWGATPVATPVATPAAMSRACLA